MKVKFGFADEAGGSTPTRGFCSVISTVLCIFLLSWSRSRPARLESRRFCPGSLAGYGRARSRPLTRIYPDEQRTGIVSGLSLACLEYFSALNYSLLLAVALPDVFMSRKVLSLAYGAETKFHKLKSMISLAALSVKVSRLDPLVVIPTALILCQNQISFAISLAVIDRF